MSTAVTSPSSPTPDSTHMTGSAERHSLAPAPPPTAPDPQFSGDTGSTRSAALSEFQHGMTASIGR